MDFPGKSVTLECTLRSGTRIHIFELLRLKMSEYSVLR